MPQSATETAAVEEALESSWAAFRSETPTNNQPLMRKVFHAGWNAREGCQAPRPITDEQVEAERRGAEWQRSRDVAELERLTAELQAARATSELPDRETLIERASLVMQEHYLDTLSSKLSPDNLSSCICGGWSEGAMEPGWDDHLAEVLADAGLLAALSTQPAAGGVEWEYGALTPDKLGMDVMVDDGAIPVLNPPEQIYRRRKAGPWEKAQS